MGTSRRYFHSDSLFALVLAASLVGHVSLRWLHLATAVEPQLPQSESGRTSVSVQWIAEAPPEPAEPLERIEPLPLEHPDIVPTPDVQAPDTPLVRESLPTEMIEMELRRTGPAPLAAVVVPRPRLARRPQATESAPASPRGSREDRTVPRRPSREKIKPKESTVEVPETLVSRESSGSDVPPAFVSRPLPVYPETLLLQGIEGVVRLMVTVKRDGRVASAKVYSSSGYTEMDNSALRTVQSWVFSPARRGGIPVEKTVIVPIRFKIRTEE